ncbi:hypothetical protein NDN08_004979 [Rhodosorus marinus]|uniref:Chlorophyll a-b binding protein, chloroplastic n=1 Tax=Rhodosorus marinus TaxID=101924 RepID=A0AAV8UGN7_9RHOD|nr:hypothetical protein NDN08_004979 [Rhodosorus marinus]
MAFVSGTSFVGAKVGRTSAVSRRPDATMSKRTVVSMGIEDRLGPQDPKPGFNFLNEQLNGRLAMMGFVIGLSTEILNPAHPTIVQQVQSIFGH